jgi:hypothetical protein
MFASLALVVWMAPASRCAEVSFMPSPKLQVVGWLDRDRGG